MDISVAIASAWSLLKNISLGVGANELHRQLVACFQRAGAADLDLQKALYASLLDAIDSLDKTLSADNHPYFLTISDINERRDEQQRIREIFKEIRAHLPKVSALQGPVTLMLEDSSPPQVRALLKRVGLEPYLESLPESVRNVFENNLPFAMLAHFRRQVATDDRLHALLQLDLTAVGFQAVQRELRAIVDFLRKHCGSDDPAQIQFWTESLAEALKNFMAGEFKDVKEELNTLGRKIDQVFEFISEIYDRREVQHLSAGFYPIRGKLLGDGDSLPYHQLGGPGLERLCYLLLLADGKVPRYFGKPGQKQYGIDLLVTDGDGCTVYQCKNEESFSIQKMEKALRHFEEEWLGRSELPRPKQFVLCCPLPLQERQQNEAWTKLERRFCERTDVSVEFWDRNYFDERLRRLPDVVADLFSDRAAERFCDLEDWNSDLFRPVAADSGERAITRYLEKNAAGQIYVAAKLAEDFTEKLERNGSLLIQGLPGSGKTITGLALAESFHDGRYRLFYVSLRHDIDEDTLVKGIRRRLSRPTIFLLDDCHDKFDMLDLVQNRLSAEMRGKGFLVFMARTTPTPEDMPRGDYSDFEESLKEAEALLEFQPTLAVFSEIITRVKPHFAGLSEERSRKIFEFTGHDLLLLDQLLATIDSPEHIDQLKPEKLFEKTLVRYFGAPTVHRPGYMRLAVLAQFDLAPPVSSFPHDLEEEDEKAAAQLLVKADRPLRYFFLHSSAAELIFRALAWNSGRDDYPELAANHLIEFFKNSQESVKQLAIALSSVIRNRLKLTGDENEENRLKSQFLADDSIYALIEQVFEQLPLNLLSLCLIILKSTDTTAFARYQDLVHRRIEDGTVLNMAIACGFSESVTFLQLIKREYPLLFSNVLRNQLAERGLSSLIKMTRFSTILKFLKNFAEPDESEWAASLDLIIDNEFDEMIQRTIDFGRSFSAIEFALRELKKTNPDLLEKLERKIGSKCYLHLIASAGTISDLFKIIEHSSLSMADKLIEALDTETLDTLIAKTIASGRSIGTIDLALRELKKTNPALLEKLEHKIGAQRYLHLIVSAGTIFELFMIIKDSSISMTGELIDALNIEILDTLITETITSSRSIGTIHWTLRELKETNPDLLKKLERKIGAKRYLHLIASAGTIFELFMIIRYSSPSMVGELIDALDTEILDALITETIISSRSIGTIDWTMRELKETSPALLEKLERKIGAKRWWQLICTNGTMSVLMQILHRMDRTFRREFVQGSKHISLAQWQVLLLRGDFADLSLFVRWSSLFFSKQFTADFLSALKPTFETLIRRDGWEVLNRGAGLLRESLDSSIKKYLSDLLHDYLAMLNLDSLRFSSFGEATRFVHLLSRELPPSRKELSNSLLSIFPEEKVWYIDETFLLSARKLFFFLTNLEQAKSDDARRVLSISNSKEVAALCAEATSLDLFLYLWNLYSLWFQWEREGGMAFVTFLNSEILDAVSNVLVKRLRTHASQEETHNLVALAGFFSFIGLAVNPTEKAGWLSSLPSFDELEKRVQPKTFIPGFFFLLGLEWIFDRTDGVTQHTWRRLLPKAEAYTEKPAALEHLRDFVRARAGSKV